jgi:CheY-like chemotaxis protein
MTEDVLAKAMDPFFTTKGLGAGTGLGLSGAADFARQAGGFVSIKSSPGHGCAVSIYLPRAERKAGLETGPGPSKSSFGRERVILVVEDDDEVREATRRRLEALGYVAIEAKTGPDAMEQLNAHGLVQLVLSDIIMPGGMSGYDVARWVATHKPGVRVILCTGYNEGDRGEDDARGLVVLAKPYTRNQLAQAINDAFARVEKLNSTTK